MSQGKRARDGLERSRALPGEDRPVPIPITKWRSALPDDAWPVGFPKSGHVWRQDVFDVAERWLDGRCGARPLLAATLMWTYGEQSGGRRRAVRTLAGDPTGALLEYALQSLRANRPRMTDLRAAYLALRTTARLPELDSDTCTRLLYFAGYRRGGIGIQPLILDETIVRRLPRDSAVSSPASRGSSLEWVRYIVWAINQVAEGEEPDRVEMDLAAGGARYGEGSNSLKNWEARGRHARR
ncbi:MAG TPA: hypothetical protein VMZ00_10380 [Sporichthya sp.]|nr:hypothetical protein [Sporichthya sp.]